MKKRTAKPIIAGISVTAPAIYTDVSITGRISTENMLRPPNLTVESFESSDKQESHEYYPHE